MADTIYLEPLGSYTNQALVDFPLDDSLITEVQTSKISEPIRVWEVTESQLSQIKASKANSSLEFNVYVRSSKSKYVRKIPVDYKKLAKINAARKLAESVKMRTRKSA